MKQQYGVKTKSGVLFGPYSLDEATRVAEVAEKPNEVVLISEAGNRIPERASVPQVRARVPTILALALLLVSVYFAQGPGVLLVLTTSPRAFVNIPRASDIPTERNPFNDIRREHREQGEAITRTTYWAAGLLGASLFLASAILLVIAFNRLGRRLSPSLAVVSLLWMAVLVYALVYSPNGAIVSSGGLRNIWHWSGD